MKYMENIECSQCGNSMPKLRKELYGYTNCINCSTEKPKMARMVFHEKGINAWNDIEIIDYDTAQKDKNARPTKNTLFPMWKRYAKIKKRHIRI